MHGNHDYLCTLGRLASIDWIDESGGEPDAAIALVDDLRILIPMAGLIDVAAEQARLNKEIGKEAKDASRIEAKLNNENFTSRAPEHVVAKEREKLSTAQTRLVQLKEQLERISKL